MDDLTSRKPTAYTLAARYRVSSWKELLVAVCRDLYRAHPKEFQARAFSLRGRKRKYFSDNPKELWQPEEVAKDVYVSTHFSANRTVKKICYDLLARFGYDKQDLKIRLANVSEEIDISARFPLG